MPRHISKIAAVLFVLVFARPVPGDPSDCPPPTAEEKAAEEKAFAAWRKVYHLEPKQVVKRVTPPFIVERMAAAERRFPFIKENRERRGFPLTFIYKMKGDNVNDLSMTFSGDPLSKGRQLVHLIESVADIPAQDVEGPKELLEKEISGDFLVRDDATTEDVVSALESILWLECGLKINLKLREVERDVVVVKGKFRFKPRVEGRDVIDLYGATIDPNQGGGGTGDFAKFLEWTGDFVEPKARMVSEIQEGPKGDISWHLNARSPFTPEDRLADHDAKAVLKHLEEQTGLTFTPGKKKVRTLFVEMGK